MWARSLGAAFNLGVQVLVSGRHFARKKMRVHMCIYAHYSGAPMLRR
jgi:hypothetical protein